MLTTGGEGLPFFRLSSGIIERAESSGLPLKFQAPFLRVADEHWVEDEASFPFLFLGVLAVGSHDLLFPLSLTTSLSCFKASSGLPPSVE